MSETARLIRAYAEASALEAIALKAVMIMPHPLLQKSHRTSKTKDHVAQLYRRLKTWAEGDIYQLLHEGRTIQKQLPCGSMKNPKAEEQIAQTFAKLISEGRVKVALRLITNKEKVDIFPLDSQIHVYESTTKVFVMSCLTSTH